MSPRSCAARVSDGNVREARRDWVPPGTSEGARRLNPKPAAKSDYLDVDPRCWPDPLPKSSPTDPAMLSATGEGRRKTSRTSSFLMAASFTTSASENPTLTIVTLAIRQAGYIADKSRKGNI